MTPPIVERRDPGDAVSRFSELDLVFTNGPSARYLRDLDQLVDDIPGHPRPAALESAHGRPGRPAPTHGRPGRPAPGQGHWQPLPARAHPAFGGAWIVFALIILTIALHGWWLPIWPVVLIGFLVLRGSRHHRRGLDGHWGSRV